MAQYFASCPKSLETLLLNELNDLGAQNCRETVAGVYFDAPVAKMYEVCLWTRFANRILWPIEQADITSDEDLYQLVKGIKWRQYFSVDKSIIVDFSGTNDTIRNSQYGAQKVKDAVVDYFTELEGTRPQVSKAKPDIRINVRLARNKAFVAIDCSGESLHRRGYRKQQGSAPLKENLAAAVLTRAGWKTIAERGGALIDPMCGSGTFLVEAALIALNIAPGSFRKKFGFENLHQFDEQTWNELKTSASRSKTAAISSANIEIRGYDANPKVLDAAEANIAMAGLSKIAKVLKKEVAAFKKPTHTQLETGLMICNPPYGERLGDVDDLRSDYQTLGRIAKQELPGWKLGIFTGNPELGRELRLRASKTYKFFNGAIASQLQLFELLGSEKTLRKDAQDDTARLLDPNVPLSDGAQMVYNRLAKNKRKLASWLKREGVECYRIYDADMPEYSAAVDVYGEYVHVQEYQAPKTIDERKANIRYQDLLAGVMRYFNAGPEKVVSKVRKRNRGKSQYEKQEPGSATVAFTVQEGAAKIKINLSDYLDTGLFLDHRPLRKKIASEIKGKSFLNLFCYTATATVQAALAGAQNSISVDMSNTYIEWAKENCQINGVDLSNHEFVREDCLVWLEKCRQGFDVIMLDPPSFSNSKKMEGVLDVQRDHVKLIKRCMDILKPGGVLYFSNNLRSFKMNTDELSPYNIDNITKATLDADFKGNPKIHNCWQITAK